LVSIACAIIQEDTGRVLCTGSVTCAVSFSQYNNSMARGLYSCFIGEKWYLETRNLPYIKWCVNSELWVPSRQSDYTVWVYNWPTRQEGEETSEYQPQEVCKRECLKKRIGALDTFLCWTIFHLWHSSNIGGDTHFGHYFGAQSFLKGRVGTEGSFNSERVIIWFSFYRNTFLAR
jgi:hypothetical protein